MTLLFLDVRSSSSVLSSRWMYLYESAMIATRLSGIFKL